MSFGIVQNISSEFLYKKYLVEYNFPEKLENSLCYALELNHIPQNVFNSLTSQDICNLFKKKEDGDKYLYIGDPATLMEFAKRIKELDTKYGSNILTNINNYFSYSKKKLFVKEKEFSLDIPYIMGIVNVTPDSFSDGGKYFSYNDAVSHAVDLMTDGADFIDIGGESTRPGSEPVSLNEELNRVIPVIEEILSRNPEAVLSIDTTKSRVAYEALKRGVKIVNDISGLSFDPDILDVVKEFSAALIIMHIKGTPRNMQINPEYKDVVSEVYNFLEEKITLCNEKGVANLIIDPGIGFGKRIIDNYELLLRLNEFKNLGYPILVGVSKKSFLGKTLNLDINSRETATVVTEAYSIVNGARIIRTHNVRNAVQAKNIFKFITNPELH